MKKIIVEIARSCLDTPYHHQARQPGVGLDCVGLVVSVGRAAGFLDHGYDVRGYSRVPDGFSLMKHLDDQLDPVSRDEMDPGDVICVAFDGYPQHIGVLGDYAHGGLSIIHASSSAGRVIETRLLLSAAMRFVAAFRFRGV